MKKNSLFLAVLFLGFAEFIFGQKITETVSVYANLTNIEQITIGTGTPTYDQNASYGIGMYTDNITVVVGKKKDGVTDSTEIKPRKFIYRTFSDFLLSAIKYTPTNHTIIKNVDVSYSIVSFGYTFKITKPNSLPTSDSEKWSTIGSSPALYTGVTYSGSSVGSSSGLVSAVQNALANNHLYLGLASESESVSGSNAAVSSITLTITYERDKASISGTVQNDLYGVPAGKIYVDGILFDSPHAHAFYEGSSYLLSAYSPQDHAGTGGTYTYVWHQGAVNTSEWKKKVNTNTTPMGSNASVNYTTNLSENGAVFTAYMRRVCYATFNNSMPEGGGNSGYITVDGTQYNVTNVTTKIEGNSVKFWAQTNQSLINGIQPFFYKWAEDGSTSSARTETININKTYTAIYKGKPSTTDRSMRFNDGSYGSNVTLTWNTHPSTNAATCKIYRKAKVNGVMGNEMLIGTVPRGTTTFVDYDYVVSSNSTTQLFYDVRYVYTGTLPDNTQYTTESDPSFENIFGQIAVEIADNNEQKAEIVSEIPTEYSIGNFPNPFNPTTTIKYQLPEAGMVTLKVYDILGREVAELVNENKSAGYYEVNFDASKLTSGVYIYTIQAGRYSESKKMILTK